MADKDILEVPQDCVLCTYYLILSQKIKKGFGLSEVSTLTPADALGLMARSANARTHKIDGPILKSFNMVQVEDMLGMALYLKKLTVLHRR